ncbi:MAG: hypothetical protein PHF56_14875 [Desulfuromonadaceae bacterium]|nr:hypothetical protein [Desulfuromonadaceae bacterium]
MRKLLTYFMTIIFLTGCASTPNAQDQFHVELQRSSAVFDSVNNKIFGEVWKPEEPMTDFNLVRYKEILVSLQSKRAVELQEVLESYETQVLRGFEKTFVFCVFSSKKGFAMCDDARCSGVERKALSNSPEILEAWLKELPLSDCQQH